MYRVVISSAADKSTRGIPKRDLQRIHEVIRSLTQTPRPIGAKKLTTQEGYRIRVKNYRVLYYIDDTERIIKIHRIRKRDERTYG